MWTALNLTLVAAAPLLMHSGQLADPLNPFSKAIKEVSGRRRKSDADHEELARLEFLGGLWISDDGGPCLPGEALEACITEGARKSREGKAATAAILVEGNVRLDYHGPRDVNALWADPAYRLRVPARVGQVRVMRTRPIFRHWSADVAIQFNSSLINGAQVRKWIGVAGDQAGVGDWRPKFGRFAVHG
jgi:hypothetical protein